MLLTHRPPGGRRSLPSPPLGLAIVGLLAGCAAELDAPPTLSRRPAAHPAADPSGPGPWEVYERPLATHPSRLLLPSTSTEALDPVALPVPLVVFLPGFASTTGLYEDTLRHLASHGLAVLAAEHGFGIGPALLCRDQRSGLAEVQAALQEVRELANGSGELGGAFTDRLGVMGHSFGGKLAVWLATLEPAVRAAVLLDPVDGGGDNAPPWCARDEEGFPSVAPWTAEAGPSTLIFRAELAGECGPEEVGGATFFAAAAPGAWFVEVEGASHVDFLDAAGTDSCAACDLCPASTVEAAEVRRLVRTLSVDLLRRHLSEDARYGDLLDPPALEELTDLELHVERRAEQDL